MSKKHDMARLYEWTLAITIKKYSHKYYKRRYTSPGKVKSKIFQYGDSTDEFLRKFNIEIKKKAAIYNRQLIDLIECEMVTTTDIIDILGEACATLGGIAGQASCIAEVFGIESSCKSKIMSIYIKNMWKVFATVKAAAGTLEILEDYLLYDNYDDADEVLTS